MVPKTIRRRLSRLRRRELLLRLTWGLARAAAVVLVLLGLACLTDWVIDRFQETPWAVRVALFTAQVAAAAAALVLFLVWPLLRRPGDTELALLVESKVPDFHDRLISAVQLNRAGAQTEGMSPELIARVTAEADDRAARLRFTQVADHRRLAWGAALVLPLLLTGGLAYALWPETVTALLDRQALADVDIPRSVYLTVGRPEVWYRPNNEEVVLLFRARGPAAEDAGEGTVRISPEGQDPEVYPLKRESVQGPEEAVYAAHIPPSAVNFTYRAWLADGRTPRAAEVRYAPRPVVTEQQAWVLLPESIGLRPKSHRPYEQEAARAEIVALRGSAARVRVKVQKPVREAVVETLASLSLTVPERVRRRVRLDLDEGGRVAAGEFKLREDETAYRVVVRDEHDFENVPPPRRGIRIVEEDRPQVALLREEFRPGGRLTGLGGSEADFEVEGMPVPPGGRFRVAYSASGPYGVGAARLLVRVVRKAAEGSEEPAPPQDEHWIPLPLVEVKAPPDGGPFDLRRGVFAASGDEDQVPFFAVPSFDPEHVLGRTQAGGRFDFVTKGIPDGKGGLLELRPGDELEYCVEVSAGRDWDSGRPTARSETRRKTVVSVTDLVRWLDETLQEERRIRHLEAKQRGVFDGD